jgi:hypothetical protein
VDQIHEVLVRSALGSHRLRQAWEEGAAEVPCVRRLCPDRAVGRDLVFPIGQPEIRPVAFNQARYAVLAGALAFSAGDAQHIEPAAEVTERDRAGPVLMSFEHAGTTLL